MAGPARRRLPSGADDTPAAAALRAELRGWLHDTLTPDVVAAGTGIASEETIDVLRAWNAHLADAGWAAPAWPREHGGRDATVPEQLAYLEEMSAARAPGPVNVIGVSNIAPAIMRLGTSEQQDRHLSPMLRGDEIWSQGMSEPDAGSDLASLRCSAVLDGDDFVVNGQKTWNSLGHLADWCQLYVRTGPPDSRHKGISCLLVDLTTPGIEARPLRTITGDRAFSELFLTDARIPRSALLGEVDRGWGVAMTTLSFERAGVARLHLMLRNKLDDLLATPEAAEALADRRLRQRVAAVHTDIECMRLLTDRILTARSPTEVGGGAGASLTKLAWSRTDQRLAELALDMVGVAGVAGLDDRWADNLVSSRQVTIAGGTTEINRNIVAEHGLGLPR